MKRIDVNSGDLLVFWLVETTPTTADVEELVDDETCRVLRHLRLTYSQPNLPPFLYFTKYELGRVKVVFSRQRRNSPLLYLFRDAEGLLYVYPESAKQEGDEVWTLEEWK